MVTAERAKLRSTRQQEKLDQLNGEVESVIADLQAEMEQGHSAHFLECLEWWSQFHHYSLMNSLLIRFQRPDAIQVAGLKEWIELGYTIKQGEQGIGIRAPWLVNEVDDKTGGITGKRFKGHSIVWVFNVQQTNEFATKGVPEEFQAPYGEADSPQIKEQRRTQGRCKSRNPALSPPNVELGGGVWRIYSSLVAHEVTAEKPTAAQVKHLGRFAQNRQPPGWVVGG